MLSQNTAPQTTVCKVNGPSVLCSSPAPTARDGTAAAAQLLALELLKVNPNQASQQSRGVVLKEALIRELAVELIRQRKCLLFSR
jgi:hypothetical protein